MITCPRCRTKVYCLRGHVGSRRCRRLETARIQAAALAPELARGPGWLRPVGDPLAGVTEIEQARAVLADLNAHVADAMEARDQVLEFLLRAAPPQAKRRRLPGPPYAISEETSRRSRTLKLRIGPRAAPKATCHLFLGFYPPDADGHRELGEVFIQLARDQRNSLAGGGYHFGAKMFSLARQHGTPLDALLRQMRLHSDASGGQPYGPDDAPLKGSTGVRSLTDYVGQVVEWVAIEEGWKKPEQ